MPLRPEPAAMSDRQTFEGTMGATDTRAIAAFSQAAVGMAYVGADDRILEANAKFCELSGRSRAQVLALTHSDILCPDDIETYRQVLQPLWQDPQLTHAAEYRYSWPDGSSIWCRVSASVVLAPNGEYDCLAIVAEDISDYKQNEDILRANESAWKQSQERLNSILSSLDDVVWSVTPDGRQLLFLNSAAAEVYGRSMSACLDMPRFWLNAVHPDDRDRVQASFENLSSKGSHDIEYRIIRPDGELRWMRERSRLVRDEDELPARVDSLATDITLRKQHEIELQKLNVELESRVDRRTEELSRKNRALEQAKRVAEVANRAKSEF
ncbi:MAG: PAS domain-containing protein, partial [Cyanobacteria bacterium J06639_1]